MITIKEKKVYLAGAMGCYRGEDYTKATKWRSKLRNNLVILNDNHSTNFSVFDPTINEQKNHDIVSQNLYYLKKCDIIVLNMEELDKSLGSLYELAYFSFTGKPVITIGKHIWLNHPYMKKFVSYSADNEKEVADFLLNAYGQ